MRVQELIEKRAKVWETAKNFVDTHEDKNGNLSAEDKETYSRMEAEIEELTNSIERQQRAERREQELSKPVNSPITGKPYKDDPQGEVKTDASDEYKKAMLTALRSNSDRYPMSFRKGGCRWRLSCAEEYDTDLSMCLQRRISCVVLPQRLPLPGSIRLTSQP